MKRSITTLMIAVGFAAGAIAQEEAKESLLPEFGAVDENEDGMLDQTEVVALNEMLKDSEVTFEFETADANEDGLIDQTEYAEYEEMLS